MDDSDLFYDMDDMINSLSLKDLEQIRLNMIRDNQSTDIVDIVIKRKKEELEEENREARQLRSMYRKAAIGGIISGIGEGLSSINNTDDYLIPNERDIVNNSDYKDYNFEEDTEEDDYYYEDE